MADHWKSIANRLGTPGVDDAEFSTKDGEPKQPTHEVELQVTDEELSFSKPLRTPKQVDSPQLDSPQPQASSEAPPAEEFPTGDEPESVPVSEKPAERKVDKPKAKKRRSSWEALASMFNVPIERSQPEPEVAPPESAEAAVPTSPEPDAVDDLDLSFGKRAAAAEPNAAELNAKPAAESEPTDAAASLADSDLSFGKSRRSRGRSRGRSGSRDAGEAERLSMFQAAEGDDDNDNAANPALEAMFPEATAEASDSWGGKKRVVDDVNWEEDEDSDDAIDIVETAADDDISSGFADEGDGDGDEPIQRRSRRRRKRGRRSGGEEAADETSAASSRRPPAGRDSVERDTGEREPRDRDSRDRSRSDKASPSRSPAARDDGDRSSSDRPPKRSSGRAETRGGKRQDASQDDDPWGGSELYVESSAHYQEPDSFEADSLETPSDSSARGDASSDDDEAGTQRRSSRRRRRGGRSRGREEASDDRSEPTAEASRSGFDALAESDSPNKSATSAGNGRTSSRDERNSGSEDEENDRAGPGRDGGRRRRRRPAEGKPRSEVKQRTAETAADDDDGAGGMEEFSRDDRDPGSHRNIPTWQDSIESIVTANTENHKRSGGRGGGPRGRSRGRR